MLNCAQSGCVSVAICQPIFVGIYDDDGGGVAWWCHADGEVLSVNVLVVSCQLDSFMTTLNCCYTVSLSVDLKFVSDF